jgi:Beta-glucosidase (SUN family)
LIFQGHDVETAAIWQGLGVLLLIANSIAGSEMMAIPVDSQPGSTKPLACPDAATYYSWEGKGTSAQYYINMPGYSIEKACVWGQSGDDFGNWAPANLGVGYSNGAAWLAIFQNLPTQPNAKLPFTVEITGDSTSDKCRYQNGQYCSGANYGTCSDKGCTVCVVSMIMTAFHALSEMSNPSFSIRFRRNRATSTSCCLKKAAIYKRLLISERVRLHPALHPQFLVFFAFL